MSDIERLDRYALFALVSQPIENEGTLGKILHRAAALALIGDDGDGTGSNPALSMLLVVLADEPPEIASTRVDDLERLANRIHRDTNGPMLCRAAAQALVQFADNESDSCQRCDDAEPHSHTIDPNTGLAYVPKERV